MLTNCNSVFYIPFRRKLIMRYFSQLILSACLFFLAGPGFTADTSENSDALAAQPETLFSIIPCPDSPSPKVSVAHDYKQHLFYCIKNNTKTPRYLRISGFNSPAIKLAPPNSVIPYPLTECSESKIVFPDGICVAHIIINGAILASTSNLLNTTAVTGFTVSAINPDGTTSSLASITAPEDSIQASSDATATTPTCSGSIMVGTCNLKGITQLNCSNYYAATGNNCEWTDGICSTVSTCNVPSPTTPTPPTCVTTKTGSCSTLSPCSSVSGNTVTTPALLSSGTNYTVGGYAVPCAEMLGAVPGCAPVGPACIS